MIGKRRQADRILVAKISGEAKHHAKRRELTADEEAAAVAALRGLAGGRADLRAEVCGVMEGASEGELHEPLARQAADCAVRPVPARRRDQGGSPRAAGGGMPRGCRRSPAACTAGECRAGPAGGTP